jgi:glycosyltransferase involved in cell wall biosynthesis
MSTALKVAFDISELGSSLGDRQGRRGINRVVEEVCHGLARLAENGGNDLDFRVASVENTAAAAAYLESQAGRRSASLPMLSRPLHRRWTALETRSRAFISNTADRALAKRALRALVSRSLPLQRRIAYRLRAFDPENLDVFHSPALTPMPQYVLRARRPAYFQTVYDLIPFQYPELVAERSIAELKTVVAAFRPEHFAICISNFVRNEFCDYLRLDSGHVFVAPLAADSSRFHPGADAGQIATARRRCGLPDDQSPYLISLCSIEPRKNLLHLIRCFARFRQEEPAARDLRLVLVGFAVESNLVRVRSLIAEQRLEKHVVLTGYVEDSEVAPLYSGAMAFVFPSLAEGFGLPPLEAMQCGVPVICSNRTSLPEVMGDAGLLIDPEDEDALCAAMGRIFNDEALREDLSRRSLARAARFSWERCAADHLDAYRTAVRVKNG